VALTATCNGGAAHVRHSHVASILLAHVLQRMAILLQLPLRAESVPPDSRARSSRHDLQGKALDPGFRRDDDLGN